MSATSLHSAGKVLTARSLRYTYLENVGTEPFRTNGTLTNSCIKHTGAICLTMSEIEETLERIKNVKGVENYVIVDKDGSVIRRYPGMPQERAEQFAAYFARLAAQARHVVRDVDPEDDLTHFRVRATKHEVLVSQGRDYMVIVQHRWTPATA